MLLGLDTSRGEDNPTTPQTIDWQKAKSAGVGFVIMKATEGTNIIDPVFALHRANLAGVLPRGSYHFWRAAQDPVAQAALYYKTAGDLELPPCLDVENSYNDLPTGTALQNKVIAQLAEIDKLFNKPCMLYVSPNIIKYFLQLTGVSAFVNRLLFGTSPLLSRKLWIANYQVLQPGFAPWPKWTFWQYTNNASAAQYGINEALGVDANWYNGTQDQFNAEFGLVPTPPPPPPPVPQKPVIKIISVSQNNALVPGLLSVRYSVDGVDAIAPVDQTPTPPPPPPAKPIYYRIKDDIEAGRNVRNGLPSTVRFHVEIAATGKPGAGFVMLTPELMQFVVKINNNGLGALKYQFADFDQPNPHILKDAVGWHNQGSGNRVEELTFSGNVIEALRVEGNKVYVKCIYNGDPAPTTITLPPVQKFTVQFPTYLDDSGLGKQPRTVIVANPGEELWLDIADLVLVS